ncbi:tRNA 2-thiouridine synthesizing protein C [Franzmannia pantelleriensis]|uniref:tRNA 2-thiouridine synthesizing protein C n=1 Tax=Franzmannia pantelleriensis TaxID=48727 RepID=A0A1G9EW27_9GAMM|nr:sulfurtransferase complex subunit TusC [Halomonas pantelleriensis]SDK80263.1 tRNA 2-thiouridine synthesizing protein C [Halomonas pantelleriensis]
MQHDSVETAGELLIILRHAPHGSSWLREGLDAALVAAAFGRQVTLLFCGEGVTALVAEQTAGPLGQKGTQPTLEMLAMYDIDTLLVDQQALDERGLTAADLLLPVRPLAPPQLAAALAAHPLVLNF